MPWPCRFLAWDKWRVRRTWWRSPLLVFVACWACGSAALASAGDWDPRLRPTMDLMVSLCIVSYLLGLLTAGLLVRDLLAERAVR